MITCLNLISNIECLFPNTIRCWRWLLEHHVFLWESCGSLGVLWESCGSLVGVWESCGSLVGVWESCGSLVYFLWLSYICKNTVVLVDLIASGPSLSWSYGSWIYNYLCNQYISQLTLWVRILLMARCTRYNIML